MQVRCTRQHPTLVDAARRLRPLILHSHSSEECKSATRVVMAKAAGSQLEGDGVNVQFANVFERLRQGQTLKQRAEASRAFATQLAVKSTRASEEADRAEA
eukprot:220587-Pleurochrysis_carterae.AAC.1